MPRDPTTAHGWTLVELLFVLGLFVTVTASAVPPLLDGVDQWRTAGAARYVAAQLQEARMQAVSRSADVGLRFTPVDGTFAFGVYVDGNGNGIRTTDITRGADRELAPPVRLSARFRDVDFGSAPGLPAIDASSTPPGGDPIRLGSGDILTFSPVGTCSSGTLYLKGGGGAQYAVRVLGATGRTRVFRFESRSGRWTLQ